MSNQTNEVFELPLKIKPEHIDALGHVNNIVYLQWVQELAIAHWQKEAHPDDQKALIWVVVRHEIDYKRSAMPNDQLIGKTWVGQASSKAFERFSEIIRSTDGKTLASAKTIWCPIDINTGKPVEVNERVRKDFSI